MVAVYDCRCISCSLAYNKRVLGSCAADGEVANRVIVYGETALILEVKGGSLLAWLL